MKQKAMIFTAFLSLFVLAFPLLAERVEQKPNPEYQRLRAREDELKAELEEIGESIGSRDEILVAADEYFESGEGSDLEDILYGTGGVIALIDIIFGFSKQALEETMEEYNQVRRQLETTPRYIEERVKEPPNTPAIPSGSSQVTVNSAVAFSTVVSDPDGDMLSYRFDWGDGSYSDWSSYVSSNSIVEEEHTFTEEGSYYVRVRARDQDGNYSGYSSSLLVEVESN